MTPQVAAQSEIVASRADYVATARSFLGARWRHQGREATGVDCVGLLIVPAIRLGLLGPDQDVTDYPRQQDGAQLAELLRQHCRRLTRWQDAQPGDILAIKFAAQPQHVAIVTRPHDPRWGCHILHAWGNDEMGGSVVEHRLDNAWLSSHRARIHAAFEIRGLG